MKTFIFAAIERSNMEQTRPACVKAQAANEQEAKGLLAPVYVIYGWMGQIVNRN
ncbi:host cell division inhibitor Icd-like protein [Xenorhabdus littoralis]|uniref:host cell division inhibitor Icd-like protein n=1 Tax=Xenorhabdus littoralis TaxID=2582835 RepID=UPI0029E804C2|nr:host cell division inhibitor Icd-like protein [Xenorhabdus sp. psl]MDX7993163.1 host cell division inhibitor Icd-like protein [Xenorhabdus sp. psl]